MRTVKESRSLGRSFRSIENEPPAVTGYSRCRMALAVKAMLDQDQLGLHVPAVVGSNLSFPEPDIVRCSFPTQLDENGSSIFKEPVLNKKPLVVHTKKREGEFALVVTDAIHVQAYGRSFRDVSYLIPGPGVSWIEVVKSLLKPLLCYCLARVVGVSVFAVMLLYTAITDSTSQSRSPEKDLVRDHQTRKGDQE